MTMNKMTSFLLAFRDYFWVINAFFRGKVLREKTYRPQGNIFRAPKGATAKRITMLAKFWGRRPMTLAEAVGLVNQRAEAERVDLTGRVPFLHWNGSSWQKSDGRGDWDNSSHHFLAARR